MFSLRYYGRLLLLRAKLVVFQTEKTPKKTRFVFRDFFAFFRAASLKLRHVQVIRRAHERVMVMVMVHLIVLNKR